MIIGIGSDIIDIRRIEQTLERFGDRFVNRCFGEIEIAKAKRRVKPYETFAKRFAAKEACSKALGTGLSQGVFWRDMCVVNLKSGAPTLELTGGAKRRFDILIPSGKTGRIHLTMTDEPPYALAWVIIEACDLG